MVSKEIVNYFKEGMKQGVSLIDLKKKLLDSGYDEKEVSEAIVSLTSNKIHVNHKDLKKIDKKKILFIFLGVLILGVLLYLTIGFFISGSNNSEGSKINVEYNEEFILPSGLLDVSVAGIEMSILVKEFSENLAIVNINGVDYEFSGNSTIGVYLDSNEKQELLVNINDFGEESIIISFSEPSEFISEEKVDTGLGEQK